ncbi:MAG: class I SAM-dependent methyltransferase, partial [Mycobacteriales bacterium]
NRFYEIVLGPSMVYSCAYWADGATTLEQAQEAKLELICRKLGLRAGMRLLDVGCGWGSLVLHAASRHGVSAVGVTVSREQAVYAEKRVADAGLADRVEIRLQDYRDVHDGPYDAISSVGMAEHVGEDRFGEYAAGLYELLAPQGRVLNHMISTREKGDRRGRRSSFIWHYVFPDGELLPVTTSMRALHGAGFEVRDMHALREHYAKTLRCWVANLDASWDEAVSLAGLRRARVWRIYMAGSAVAFEAGGIGVDQVLGVRMAADGSSGVPATRDEWTVRKATR